MVRCRKPVRENSLICMVVSMWSVSGVNGGISLVMCLAVAAFQLQRTPCRVLADLFPDPLSFPSRACCA